jgi:amidase
LDTELKADLNAYLATLPPGIGPHTLSDIIAFNKASPRELALFGQDTFETADATPGLADPAYLAARDGLKAASRAALDGLFTRYRLDALIRATDDAAFRVDLVKGDNDSSDASTLPATAGYPHLTVPMGFVRGLPLGLSFIGPAWSDAALLQLGAAFERAAPARQPPRFIPTLEEGAAFAPAPAPR